MDNLKIAVLDLGTNSFHLLISRIEDHTFQTVFKVKKYVKLASNGISTIPQEKFNLAIKILSQYKRIIDKVGIDHIKINATEGLRKASNANEFIMQVKETLNFDIDIIDGDREAYLIYKGVSRAVQLDDKNVLIMDIGGGSTEFIIANGAGIKWQSSFPLGAAVLKNNFGHTDPLITADYAALVHHLTTALGPLWQALAIHKIQTIIGASGSFDTLVSMLRANNDIYPYIQQPAEIVNLSAFKVIHLNCLRLNLAERMALPGMDTERAEMMPFSTTLISIVLSYVKHSRSIVVSSYALKEGLLLETMVELEKEQTV